MENRSPKIIMQEWLPHGLFLSILLFFGYFLLKIFLPITAPIILAASICSLTYPILYDPFNRLIAKKIPALPETLRRQYLAILSTILLIFVSLSPVFILIYSATGSISVMAKDISALVMGDEKIAQKLTQNINDQLAIIQQHIPNIPLENLVITEDIMNLIQSVHKFAPSFMSFLFKGTGSILLQSVLTLVGLTFFYAHGPRLCSIILKKTALENIDIDRLYFSHRRVILRILNDTVATSVCKGILMAIVISSFVSFPFWLTFFAATLISLLPLIGSTIVWLPMASLLWSQDKPIQAICVGILCLLVNYGVDFVRKKIGQKIYASSNIVNFFIFMSIIGGIFSYGMKGLLIGPICIIFSVVLGSFWFSIYDTKKG